MFRFLHLLVRMGREGPVLMACEPAAWPAVAVPAVGAEANVGVGPKAGEHAQQKRAHNDPCCNDHLHLSANVVEPSVPNRAA